MRGALSRLRWQLTLSHLVTIAFTLLSMIAAVLVIVSAWTTFHSSPRSEPAQQAQTVTRSIGGIVIRDLNGPAQPASGTADLNGILSALASGDLQVMTPPMAFAPQQAAHAPWFRSSPHNLAYIAVVDSGDRVIGSSDSSGPSFSPPERPEWDPLVGAALSGQTSPGSLVALRSGGGPAALGAYPIFDNNGRVVAAVLIAETSLSSAGPFSSFWSVLAIFSAATVAVLMASFVFALAPSALVGYLLSRRLVRRLERLGRAAESLAAGDLTQRVDEGSADEVGQLARRFNHMAGRLASTVTELEDEKQHAQEALRAKRELVANVSHELRTPLASIRGHTESLLMRNGDAPGDGRHEYLEVIHRETERLSRLIDDLFLLSTTEAGALPLSLRPVDLGEVVEEVAGSMRSVAQSERRVSIVTRVDPDLTPVLADRERVAQVLANLVRNAVRHTPEGGLISVRTARDDGHATVTVEDTGIGIPPDQLPHVFERFYRGDPGRDRASGRAGLGLAIVREFVEAMGGEVSVESSVGQGSRFSFTLPFAADASPGPTIPPVLSA